MQSRQAWLSAVAAALGVSVAACKGSGDAVVAVKEVTSPSTSVAAAASLSPSASPSSSATPSASVMASASAVPSVSAPKTSAPVVNSGLQAANSGGLGLRLNDGNCGARANCGGVGFQQQALSPTAQLTVRVSGTPAPEPAVHSRLSGLWRACANGEIAKNPSLKGSLTMQIAIAVDGSVTSAVVTTNNSVPTSVTECMLARVRSTQFTVGTAPRTLNVSVSIQAEK